MGRVANSFKKLCRAHTPEFVVGLLLLIASGGGYGTYAVIAALGEQQIETARVRESIDGLRQDSNRQWEQVVRQGERLGRVETSIAVVNARLREEEGEQQ